MHFGGGGSPLENFVAWPEATRNSLGREIAACVWQKAVATTMAPLTRSGSLALTLLGGTRAMSCAPAPHITTPLVRSAFLSSKLGSEVFLKMDCLQPSGSFKLRGIGATVAAAQRSGASGVVSSSGGNAGLATAHAAAALGLRCTVVLPSTTPDAVRAKLEDEYGASVVVFGDVWDEANVEAERLAEESGGALVHPFEGEETWRGHATVVEEVDAQLREAGAPPMDALVTCVGGGGLLMGLLRGLAAKERAQPVTVVAAETAGADSFAHSMAARKPLPLPGGITSIAKSLGATTPSAAVLAAALDYGHVVPHVVSDAAAVAACAALANERRVLVEPACGAACAAVYGDPPPALQGKACVVVEVCGGAVVSLPALRQWAADLGVAAF